MIDKRTHEVYKTKYYADKPFFFFHYANAYEDGDHIVMDIDSYPNERVLDLMNVSYIRSGMFDGDPSHLIRFALPLAKNVKVGINWQGILSVSFGGVSKRRYFVESFLKRLVIVL